MAEAKEKCKKMKHEWEELSSKNPILNSKCREQPIRRESDCDLKIPVAHLDMYSKKLEVCTRSKTRSTQEIADNSKI